MTQVNKLYCILYCFGDVITYLFFNYSVQKIVRSRDFTPVNKHTANSAYFAKMTHWARDQQHDNGEKFIVDAVYKRDCSELRGRLKFDETL
jgi:hypothetical protein